MGLTPISRTIAEGIIRASDALSGELGNANAGSWSSSYLWDNGILNMRVHGGELTQWMSHMNDFGDDLLQMLPNDVRGRIKGVVNDGTKVLDAIHTDKDGLYRPGVEQLDAFGKELAPLLKKILEESDAAEAHGATQAVEGVSKVGEGPVNYTVTGSKQTNTVTVGGPDAPGATKAAGAS